MIAAPDDVTGLAQLLRAVADGDKRAFDALYQRSSAKLFGVCMGMLRERGAAEDALQEVYTSVWRRASSFDPARAAAMTWLITLTRNRCIDHLRRHREAPLDDAAARALVDPQPLPVAEAERGEQRQRLEHCLERLEPTQKNAVRAAFFSGSTYKELATRADVPLATMKSWIRRSLIRLRACLES